MDKLTIIWLIVAVVMAVIEASTVQLVSVWFSIGAVAACVTSLFCDSLPIQLIVFAVTSGVALIVTRPLVKRIKVKKAEATNADRLVGKQGVVLERIDNEASKGLVRVGTEKWSARSENGDPVEKDASVTIVAIEGVKLIVKP